MSSGRVLEAAASGAQLLRLVRESSFLAAGSTCSQLLVLLTSTQHTCCQMLQCADCREKEQPPYQYIATQGPLASTTADFWQMVAEQGTSVVVMLTRCMEADMCERFRRL